MFKRLSTYLCLGLTSLSISCLEATLESIKSNGMGGAVIAHPQDSLSAAANPALALWAGTRWDLGGEAQVWSKKLTIGNRPAIPNLQSGAFTARRFPVGYPSLGYNVLLNRAIAVNICCYTSSCIDTKLGTQITEFSGVSPANGAPIGSKAEMAWRVDTVTTSIACRVNESHTVGIGLNIHAARLKMNGLNNIPDVGFSLSPTKVTDRGNNYSFGFGVTIGWLGYMADGLWVGASYSPQTYMNKFKKYEGLLADPHINLPDTWKLGVAYDFCNCITIAADGEWRRYSYVKGLSNDFPGDTAEPFTSITFFGRADGPGFGWRDEYKAKIGIEYSYSPNLTLRLGYRHEWLPLQNDGTNTALNVFNLQTVSDYITIGSSCCINGYEISAFGEYGFPNTLRSNYPQIETIDFIAGDLAFRSHNYAVGLSVGRSF